MSIIEQHLAIESPPAEDSVQALPFSWKAAEERARLRRLSTNCPTPLDRAIASSAVPSYDAAEERERLQQIEQNQAAIQFLQELRTGNPEEQTAVLAYLTQVLDEDRYSTRKLFS